MCDIYIHVVSLYFIPVASHIAYLPRGSAHRAFVLFFLYFFFRCRLGFGPVVQVLPFPLGHKVFQFFQTWEPGSENPRFRVQFKLMSKS